MKVTFDIKSTLVKTAKAEYEASIKEVEKLEQALDNARLIQREKLVVVEWADGLVVGAELMMKPDWNKVVNEPLKRTGLRRLYHAPSKSGRKYGHYIEVYENGISCTCPGFVNRGYCHASTEIKKQIATNTVPYARLWLLSTAQFDREQDAAIADSKREKVK